MSRVFTIGSTKSVSLFSRIPRVIVKPYAMGCKYRTGVSIKPQRFLFLLRLVVWGLSIFHFAHAHNLCNIYIGTLLTPAPSSLSERQT
jgi:branched-subunit amino acid permease